MIERKKSVWELAFLSALLLGVFGVSLLPFTYIYSILR